MRCQNKAFYTPARDLTSSENLFSVHLPITQLHVKWLLIKPSTWCLREKYDVAVINILRMVVHSNNVIFTDIINTSLFNCV